MRLALCMSGEMRGCPECLSSLSQCIAQPFVDDEWEVDLFIWTRKDDWWLSACDLRFRTLHVERNVPQNDKRILSLVNPPDRGSYETTDPSDRRAFFYQSYLHYYRALRGVWRLCKEAENQDGKLYDLVARVRPDVSYERPIRLDEIDCSIINLPCNDWWPYTYPAGTPDGGEHGKRIDAWSDKFAIGPSKLMDTYFNRIHYLEGFCQKYELMAEALMVWQLEQANVPYARMNDFKILRSTKMYEHSWRPDRESK